jgi:hypothetical protein
VAEVPLADDGGGVAGLLEGLSQGALLQRQAVLRPRAHDADLKAVAHRVAAGHQGGPRRRADGQDVELLQLRAGRGELVEVRRLVLALVPADVGPAEVIGEEDDDVRLGRLRVGEDRRGQEQKGAGAEGTSQRHGGLHDRGDLEAHCRDTGE